MTPDEVTAYQISIHAAREGGDAIHQNSFQFMRISIHAAREGGDPCLAHLETSLGRFQSTPPVKAATAISSMDSVAFGISIHAAREGGDRYQPIRLLLI